MQTKILEVYDISIQFEGIVALDGVSEQSQIRLYKMKPNDSPPLSGPAQKPEPPLSTRKSASTECRHARL